ncbi:hypothetical protein ABZW38_24305 [Streptomyces bacillaris]
MAYRWHLVAKGVALPPEGGDVRYRADGGTLPPSDVVAALAP